MSVQRRVNWLSQQRVDVPDLRAVESAVSNDFDNLIKSFVTGTSQGYLLRGFELSMAGAIGGAASGLQMIVDPGAVFHINSSQSGTVYLVPPGTAPQQLNSATNTIVDGAFSPSAINYVGIEYERFIDDATSSQVYLWNPTTKDETTKNAPRAQVLRYRIKISTSTPPSTVLPVAAITTDSGNNVLSITDARNLLFRLGQGGFSPNPFYVYPWTAQVEGRTENPSTSNNNSINPFHGGDKMIGTLKDLLDALMTSIKEIKGTTYWYSTSSSGSLESLRQDLGNTIITGRGHIAHSKTTPGLINWDQDINVRVIGSNLTYTLEANPASTDITLSDEEVAYITLIRGIEISPNLVFTNGSAIVTSVGSIAWTAPLQSGDWIKIGSETDAGYYQIDTVDSLTQVTLVNNFGGTSTGVSGAKAKYAFGSYQTSATPSTNRDIFIADRGDVPSGENIFWLFARSDNAGSVARVYIRFLGSEIQQGETEEISDTTALEILEYMGSPIESATEPQYASALNPAAVPEISELTFGDASTISSNQYFYISSSGDFRQYYVWFNKDGTGVDPAPLASAIGIEVAISTGDTAADVAAAVETELNNTYYGDFEAVQLSSPDDDTVEVTNSSAGACADPINFDVGAPFSILVTQQGVGSGTSVIQDGDNLTLAIAKLDQAIAALSASLDDPSYDETIDIVASGGTPPTSIDGPVLAGTLLTLPLNSRFGNIQQQYTVGKGVLVVHLNGQVLRLGQDWDEVGAPLTASTQIEILQDLDIGDYLDLRINALGGGGGGGGGGQGPQGPPGPQGPAGQDALGGPINISTKIADYTVQNTDKVLKADCSVNSANITFTLPTAASATGMVFYFKKIDASAFSMIIQANGAELIDGSNTQSTSVQWEGFMLISDGVTWSIH